MYYMYLKDDALLQGGKYRVVRFLSSGGFGNTYEGIHTMMDTRVAIKEFFPKMFCNRDENTSHVTVATQGNRELVDKLRKKFNEEAKAVFQMKHDNIVRVLDIFEENGTAYYVMEYIDGKSLNDITKERGALPEAEAVGFIRQVADALKYVHTLNRLHLDIKPGNIMVDKNGKAILIDFGASKHYDDESGENTSTLMGVNTKGYAPIEQSTQSFTSFSPATDIYALGATLYKLLTGITPPDANLLMAEEETLQPLPTTISTSTRNAAMAAMALKRSNRPQSVEAWMNIFDAKEASPIQTTTSQTIANREEKIDQREDEDTFMETRARQENPRHLREINVKAEPKDNTTKPVTTNATYGLRIGVSIAVCIILAIIVWHSFFDITSQSVQQTQNTQTSTKSSLKQDFDPFNSFTYEKYDNYRFTIYYPSFMEPKGESANGDGQRFYMKKNNYLRCYGYWNVNYETLSEIYDKEQNNIEGTIVYKTKKNNWFVISGKDPNGLIFYQKTALNHIDGEEAIVTAILYYEEKYKQQFEPIIKHIFSKFPN